MAGIYIHIPFCKKACHYCNFHFSTQTQHIDAFTQALIKEIALQKHYLHEPVETIYFGGGTPSLLPQSSLEAIVTELYKQLTIAENIEFTFEANPDDITSKKVQDWKKVGVNRLSIGIQSFQNNALAWMNRAHQVAQSFQAIEAAQDAQIYNISVDLIYGTPHLKDEELIQDIAIIKKYEIPHVSCYALTVEEKTALHHMIEKGKIANINTEDQARQFELIVAGLQAQGMEHYEISNFAKPGKRSRHNSSYWKGIPYLGLGPSAHSFNGQSRQWNIANNALYIQSIEKETLPFELEHLDLYTKYNEYMMVSLRCMEGIDKKYIEAKFGNSLLEHTIAIASDFIQQGKLLQTEKGYTIHPNARFLADGIASDFFWIQ